MLNWDDIKDFLADTKKIQEKANLECKAAANSLPKDFWKSFSAFSNTQGGFILLGITEKKDGEFCITGVSDARKIVDDLYSQARGGQKVSCHYLNDDCVLYENDIFAEKSVIAIYVQKAENNSIPVYLNGDITNAYVRLNTGDHKLSPAELKNFLSSYTKINQDNKVIPNTSISEIHLPTLDKYRQYIKNYNSTSPLLARDDLSLLKKINGYQIDLKTGKSGLTYAGLLMFGKLDIIRSLLPHYLLEYKSKETDHRYDDRITCDELEEGNLFEFYLKVAPKLSDLAKNKHFALDQLTRSEDNLITGALREAFINMLTHSDYLNDRVTLKVSQTSNTLNFENPGVMLVSILEAQSGKKSICRNATLHNMFRRIGLCEREGKGIETIFLNYRKELLTTPVLSTDSEKTLLTLTLQDSSVIQANQQLHLRLGAQYQNLDNDLYKKILLLTALNGGWIKHPILSEKLEKDYHSRDITLALPALERKRLLLGKGEKKDKFYVLPWVDVGDLKEIYGKRHEVTLNTQLSFNVEGLSEEANLEANLEAKNEHKLVYYSFDLDDLGRTIKNGRIIINELDDLNPDFLESLKNIVPSDFYRKKKKNRKKLKELVLTLCSDQFVTKKSLAKLLGITESALWLHLKEFVEQGMLELAFPQQPTHKDQSYRVVK